MPGLWHLNVAEEASERQGSDKQPFPHQQEAFSALSKTLPLPVRGYRGTLLVLPTGAGKTFTAIRWICRHVLSRGIKVLWLAQSGYLLDQARESFVDQIHHASGRDVINLRVVSSSSDHANAGTIALTDDVLICTVQTAIATYKREQLDGRGNSVWTPFRNFVDDHKADQLFVVVDEAHHTPAYGCRNLLISMRESIPNLYVLGLTATPTHNDKRISGWLKNIYDKWICYEASKEHLEANKILAVPHYLERQTGMEFEVDDELFNQLTYKHKDLPEKIIETLARDQGRNNLIVDDYHRNRREYGKTIIFADRWFQCEYIVDKLKSLGVATGAVYSSYGGQIAEPQGSGRHNDEDNRNVMQDFRDGKHDVVVNVRMLTEGIDVPDVKTVMITRQTTSSILLTQMMGRALRGERAGGGEGKDFANIVFFHDTWRRLLPWAEPEGGLGDARPAQKRNPLELVSILLVRLAAADIPYEGFEDADYLSFIPVGFLGCEYTTVSSGESEEMITVVDNATVYQSNRDGYDQIMEFLEGQDLNRYAAEDLSEADLAEAIAEWAPEFFDFQADDVDGSLMENLSSVVRHMAQNETKPTFFDFSERDQYDLDRIAHEWLSMPAPQAYVLLKNQFDDEGLYWKLLYKNFGNFWDAYLKSQLRALQKASGIGPTPPTPPEPPGDVLTEEVRQQIFMRDNFTCLCCGKQKRRGVILNIDHIIPVSMGGTNAISNLQTLCRECNSTTGVNEIDFRQKVSPRTEPGPELKLFSSVRNDDPENAIARIVNTFYHCGAQCELVYHVRSNGRSYHNWEIVLYTGNHPEWLEAHRAELLGYIRDELGRDHVRSLVIRN